MIIIIIIVEESLIVYNIDIYYHYVKLGNSFEVTVVQTACKHTAILC